MIPFIDLKAQYRSIKEEIDAAVHSVLESSQFILGSEVKAFEEEFAAFCAAMVARYPGHRTVSPSRHVDQLAFERVSV